MTSLQSTNAAQHLFTSHADALAARNWSANLRAMATSQPRLVESIQQQRAAASWLFGRDGSLTGQTEDGAWLTGCSVPLAAARAILKKLEVSGVIACFLAPGHAAQIVAAFEKMLPEQGLIAIVPETLNLRRMLACADFSDSIESGRLHFAWGELWVDELRRLFQERPGLPTPSQFIRTPLIKEETMNELIGPSQTLFSDISRARAEQVRELIARSQTRASSPRTCVIASSKFRLWNDSGSVLAGMYSPTSSAQPSRADKPASIQGDAIHFDPACPASASPLALATLLADCGGVVSAGLARSDIPDVACSSIPWITWITTRRIPQRTPEAARDALIVADSRWRDLAIAQGWPTDRVFIAGWPQMSLANDARAVISLITDTLPTTTPKSDSMSLSSHRLLWDHIRTEIAADPFALGIDPSSYLIAQARKFSINEQSIDRGRFIDRLIVPAYQQSLARILIDAKCPLELHGQGWDEIDEFRTFARGPVLMREDLNAILSHSAALLHPLPSGEAHPVDAAPRMIIRPGGTQRNTLLFLAKAALGNLRHPATPETPPITPEIIRRAMEA